ncbi:RNA polymerase sigma factor SigX [Oceanobacillus bengalensis]|uniref:RNA polymerase sigma factor n=1 Tax=Oceanobacillus bengalensis TaxID=1435466 RepID=A0A494Z0X6_9BACI|nr:RNA polymerase sigma factor SigX [Oceanobacillus bengalensis]RKQ16114.1 sigma-70 family RNA polymerase sigma factor [Oceanobacillus bengalensis]
MKTVFDKLYDEYHQDLFQFIFYMVKDKQLTEDLVQEVYIKVLKSYSSFKGESSEKTWLFSIARHVTFDYFRSLKRRKKSVLDFFDWSESGESIMDENILPEAVAIQNDEMRRIYHIIDRCSVDQKSVLILRFIQSFSIKETAEILNCSVSKVKTTQHRALKTLRKHLSELDLKEGIE